MKFSSKRSKQMLWTIGLGLIMFIFSVSMITLQTSKQQTAVPANVQLANQNDYPNAAIGPTSPEQPIEKTYESTSLVSNNQTSASESVEENEGAPEGYLGRPPVCDSMSQVEYTFTAALDPTQTLVEVYEYKYYVNDTLTQSSSNASFVFIPANEGTFKIHAILNTNFGETLPSTFCTATIEVGGQQ